MANIEYAAPTSVEDAANLLWDHHEAVSPLAGGTDLLVQMRSRRVASHLIVDLKRIPHTIGIRKESGSFVIGAATPCVLLGEHRDLAKTWPGLVEAANLIGSTQVQGRATVAGNLCNASPAADSVPALIAAGAIGVIAGRDGRREIPVEQIVVAPGRNALLRGEFVLEVKLPVRPNRAADAYMRAIPRTEMDIAVVGAGVDLMLDENGVCVAARMALGAVAPTAILVPEAGKALVGTKLNESALSRMEEAIRAACRPINDKRGTAEYRTAIAGALMRRVALKAYERAEQR